MIAPIENQTRLKMNADAMVKAIKAAVMQGEFLPGHRLVEAELMIRFDVGRGAVREALRRLSDTGLILIEPNKGASVRRSSRKELADTFAIRSALEGQAARQAADNLDTAGLRKRVEAALVRERALTPGASAADRMVQNEAVHDVIIEASGNRLLPSILANLMMPELRTIFFQGHDAAVWERSKEDHIDILKAILAGDGDTAEQAMRVHVGHTADLVQVLPPHFLSD